MQSLTLSIVIPCFNEQGTIEPTLAALENIRSALASEGIGLELVAVDDASTDGTVAILEASAAKTERMVVIRHAENKGKGAAIQTARASISGDMAIIQDADLEYDPQDIPMLITPILNGAADAVLGTRFGGSGPHRVLYFWHRVGNGWLTLLSNMLTNLNVTDMETGYKAFTREAFLAMHLTNNRFGIEPEMIARLSQMGARVYEVPISYYGRTYAEGKKITWRDGVAAIFHIVAAWASAGKQRALVRPVHSKLPPPSRTQMMHTVRPGLTPKGRPTFVS